MRIWRELRSCGPPLVAVVVLLLLSANGLAQSNRASITGTIKDTQGSVVGGVTVTATNVATSITRQVKTDDEGRYAFGVVFDPGIYTVKVEMQGFKTATSEQLTLQIGDVHDGLVELLQLRLDGLQPNLEDPRFGFRRSDDPNQRDDLGHDESSDREHQLGRRHHGRLASCANIAAMPATMSPIEASPDIGGPDVVMPSNPAMPTSTESAPAAEVFQLLR